MRAHSWLQLALGSIFLVATSASAAPELTIYNAGFAVVHDSIPLDLKQGENAVVCPSISPFLDPASVILSDPNGKNDFRIILQRFNAGALSEQAMLSRFEGQTIPFQIRESSGNVREVAGKILRASYWRRNGDYVELAADPIIEINDKVVFSLPGTPVFPKLSDDERLKPELRWQIAAAKPIRTAADLIYTTDGLAWQTDYNAIMAADGAISQFIGWVTLENTTGLRFDSARVKLVAGDVKRTRRPLSRSGNDGGERIIVTGSNIPTAEESGGPAIQRRTFDEFHEYTLPTPVSLSDREMTQVELVRAVDVKATRSFIYDGSNVRVDSTLLDYAQLDSGFGTDSNSKIAITSEIRNDSANHLGIPLPQGQVHFYRRDDDGHLQFSGDSTIGNTPQGEVVRAVTGYAFDLFGERRQINYQLNDEQLSAEESYEIKVRNHRSEAAEIRIWEHPCRWRQWEITAQSQPFKKIDQKTFEFVVKLAPEEEKKVSYTIRYTHLPAGRR